MTAGCLSNRGAPAQVSGLKEAPDDDEALVCRAGKGDSRAAEELVHRHYSKVYRLVYRMSDSDVDAAEERTQEIFLKVFSQLKGFRQEAAFSTWVYRIAVNTCLDHRKRRRKWMDVLIPWPFGRKRDGKLIDRGEHPDSSANVDPESLLTGRQFGRAVRAAMETLTDKQRAIFHLKVYEELRIADIAVVMGMAEGTVKSHLFRATRSLRERLGEWIDKE